jgi:hypothetical protein
MEQLQKCLPEVLESQTTRMDFLMLPHECIRTVFSSNQTLVSEIRLFRLIEEKFNQTRNKASRKPSDKSDDSNSNEENSLAIPDLDFFKSMLEYIRLPLITVKHLVTDIKLSGFFNDADIFEGI